MSEEVLRKVHLLADPVIFAEAGLGLSLYPSWQAPALRALAPGGSRVSCRCANGSGKTERVVQPAALWHAACFPGSLTVTTAGVYRQLEDQLWRYIERQRSRLIGWDIRRSSCRLCAPNGSEVISFTTDEPGKFEGLHGTTRHPLMIIVDEAKTVPEQIFEAIDRCTYQRLLLSSSPGGPEGSFYRAFTKDAKLFNCFVATAYQCPHIDKNVVEEKIEKWGIDHPLIRSMIFAEFMDETSLRDYPIPLKFWDKLFANPPLRRPGQRIAFCDFGCGNAKNVISVRNGNDQEELIRWVEVDTMAAVGRFILHFKNLNLKPQDIYCDGHGPGKVIADRLAEVGWSINRVFYSRKATEDKYFATKVTEVWHRFAAMMDGLEIRLIEDDALKAQLTGRKQKLMSDGRFKIETKEEMAARGIESPDEADATIGSFTCDVLPRGPKVFTGGGLLDEIEDAVLATDLPAGMSVGI